MHRRCGRHQAAGLVTVTGLSQSDSVI
jgi:hypothetical protein